MDRRFLAYPSDLIRLYQACVTGADLSISRYIKGVNVVKLAIDSCFTKSYGASFKRKNYHRHARA